MKYMFFCCNCKAEFTEEEASNAGTCNDEGYDEGKELICCPDCKGVNFNPIRDEDDEDE